MAGTQTQINKAREKKRGRPSLFREDIIQQAEVLGGFGLTEQSMAKVWGVSAEALRRWKRKRPELVASIEKGKGKANLTISQKLYSKAKEGNMVAIIFWLTNRNSDIWRDRRALVNNQIVNRVGTDAIKDLKDNEVDEIFNNLRAKLLKRG